MGSLLKKLLGRTTKKSPEDDYNHEFEELGEREKPEGITSKTLKPNPPVGTTIEPKVLIIGGLVLIVMISFIIEIGLEEPLEKTAQEKAEEEFQKNSAIATTAIPDEIKALPGNYSLLNQKDKETAKTKTAPSLINQAPPIPSTQNQRYTPTYPTGTPTLPSIPRLTEAEKDAAAALKSPIRFISGTKMDKLDAASLLGSLAETIAAPPAAAAPATSEQDSKISFIEKNRTTGSFYVQSRLQEPLSAYEVKAGTIIPGVMISGINSDLPGQIAGQVRENVYDTVTGQHLLIPAGAKLIGVYDAKVGYGQERVLVIWNRILFPNGLSLDLEGMGGADMGGYSGFKDKTNNHTPRVLNGVFLGSLLTAGARVATGEASGALTYSQLAGQGIAENIAQAAARITEKNLNIQPTLEIQPGYLFTVFVNKDLVLAPYQP